MLHSLQTQFEQLVTPALVQRLTLLLNHVLSSEPVACDRLRPHAGRQLQVVLQNWPSLLPAPPDLRWRITAAGLLEWAAELPGDALSRSGPADGADLSLRLEAGNPAALLAGGLLGQRPVVQVEGDAQLAGDVNWLMENLRWDVAADLERFMGPGWAQPLQKLGSGLAAALRTAVAEAQGLGERLRAWRS